MPEVDPDSQLTDPYVASSSDQPVGNPSLCFEAKVRPTSETVAGSSEKAVCGLRLWVLEAERCGICTASGSVATETCSDLRKLPNQRQ